MKRLFAYTRVSTAKQGEKGVSLAEQRDAIERHAAQHEIEVVRWFEERQTAAKRGRPVFSQMLKLLRQGRADGVVIHKIDRSARNLKDWADLGELIDRGIIVEFANESIDLRSRGGRLSADIQAVVAADYVRNLREECKKGINGRLKQGLYPLPAPLGYQDRGKGKPKEPDPVAGPLVQKAFELYATGDWGLDTLLTELSRLGLKNRRGGRVTRTGLSTILNNPFYIGLIHIKRTGQTFRGVHKPLVSKARYDRVQSILRGRTPKRTIIHDFLFRRLFTCNGCGYSLIGEVQKGHVYYRCHTKGCPTTTVREDRLEEVVLRQLSRIEMTDAEMQYFLSRLERFGEEWQDRRKELISTVGLRLGQIADRVGRLTDAYLDGVLDRALFDERKSALLIARKDVEEQLESLRRDKEATPKRLSEFLELVRTPQLQYEMATPHEKREFLRIVTSNREVKAQNVVVELSQPFAIMAERSGSAYGAPHRYRPRTLDRILKKLIKWFEENPNGLRLSDHDAMLDDEGTALAA